MKDVTELNFSFHISTNFILPVPKCAVSENIHTTPTKGFGVFWWVGEVRVRQKKMKYKKLHWNFQRGWEGVLEKICSVREVWIFPGSTQFNACI